MLKPWRKLLIGGVLLVLAATPAMADEELSYNSMELAWSNNGAVGGIYSNGFSVRGLAGVSEHVYLSGAVHAIESDAQSRVVVTATTVGIGFHLPLARGVDFLSGAAAHLNVRYREDPVIGNIHQDGASVNVGLRARLGRWLELNGGVKYSRFSRQIEDTIWTAGMRLYVSPTVAAGFDVSESDDGTVWGLVLRYDLFNPDEW